MFVQPVYSSFLPCFPSLGLRGWTVFNCHLGNKRLHFAGGLFCSNYLCIKHGTFTPSSNYFKLGPTRDFKLALRCHFMHAMKDATIIYEHVKRVELLPQQSVDWQHVSFQSPMLSARHFSVNTIRVRWMCKKMKSMKGWNTSAFLWSALLCLWTINVTSAVHPRQADFSNRGVFGMKSLFYVSNLYRRLSRLDCSL